MVPLALVTRRSAMATRYWRTLGRLCGVTPCTLRRWREAVALDDDATPAYPPVVTP